MTAIQKYDSWRSLPVEERAKVGTRKSGVSASAKLTPKIASALGIEYKDHSYLWTISTDQVDRYGDILTVKDWGLKDYLAGGAPVLWAHNKSTNGDDMQNPPIGTLLHIWQETGKKAGANRLRAVRHFHRETELSRDVASLVDLDMLRASSVGFLPHQVKQRSQVEGNDAMGFVFYDKDLLEDSVVPVPANPGALVGLKGAGNFQAYRNDLERLIEGDDYVEERAKLEEAHQALQTKEHYIQPGEELLAEVKALRAQVTEQDAEIEAMKSTIEMIKTIGGGNSALTQDDKSSATPPSPFFKFGLV